MARSYLLSRTLDPLLGVFTGFLAYYLHETNPRTAPPPGHTLKDLVHWQWSDSARRREEAAAAISATEAAELEAVRREFEGGAGAGAGTGAGAQTGAGAGTGAGVVAATAAAAEGMKEGVKDGVKEVKGMVEKAV